MGIKKWGVIAPIVMFCFPLLAEEKVAKHEELAKISEAMGHLIGKNLQALGLPLDIEALVRGMQQASNGQESSMSEEDCIEALSLLAEESLSITADKNLQAANEFLEQNKSKSGVISLEGGKLQYEIVKEGNGEPIESYSKPIIRYSGKCLNGPAIASAEELLDLDETIEGFKKALVGMKEGEIRTLYIHPEYGYGNQPHPTPNALLIFEVEAIQADASAQSHAASNQDLLPGDVLMPKQPKEPVF